jgi:hypothetical protein
MVNQASNGSRDPPKATCHHSPVKVSWNTIIKCLVTSQAIMWCRSGNQPQRHQTLVYDIIIKRPKIQVGEHIV